MNDTPDAKNDSKSIAHNTPVSVDVLANDIDADDDALTISAVGTPSAGTATIVSNRVRYTPPAGFSGIATVTYTGLRRHGH